VLFDSDSLYEPKNSNWNQRIQFNYFLSDFEPPKIVNNNLKNDREI
jgi:hypothetical protein